MYNNIPSERTSKRTIFIVLLCCIALLSVLAAGYFAWIAKDVQTRLDQIESIQNAPEPAPQEVIEEIVTPVFAYPVTIQPERRSVDSEYEGFTLLTSMLADWTVANRDAGHCVHIRDFVAHPDALQTYQTAFSYSYPTIPGSAYLADEGVRAALLSYFSVAPQDTDLFFNGISAVLDSNDTFAQDYTMCASSAGEQRYLLLDDVRETILESGEVSLAHYPEVLKWLSGGFESAWVAYPAGEYAIMDGYRFYPDWYGQAVIRTGYGDAGHADWQIYFLDEVEFIPKRILVEKCVVAASEDGQDSTMACDIEYAE